MGWGYSCGSPALIDVHLSMIKLLFSLQGRVTSYRWPVERQLVKYTALKAHTEDEGPVQQFLFNEKGVISLAAKSVHFMIRRALTQWHLKFVHPC